MKNSLPFYFVCILSSAMAARAADPITAESRITDVTVYADRAQVTRTAEVLLAAGENRVVIGPLPEGLVEESARASGTATVPVTIQDVEVRRTVREQVLDPAFAELEARLQKLRDEREALDARQRVIDQQRSFLQQIQIKSAGDVSRDIQLNKLDVGQLKELPQFLGSELTRLEEETRKIATERRALDPKIRAAEAEFNKRRAAASRAEKSIVVTVNARDATKLRLQVSYVIGNASWTPSYDARAAADAGRVDLAYNGVVRQQTGEDWRGVNLTLSTARPAVGARMPELSRWTVNYVEAIALPSAAPMRAGGRSAAEKMDGADAWDEFQKTAEVATIPQAMSVEQATTSVSFRAPRAADVPADGEPHRVSVAVHPLSAEFSYAATPKLSSFAYLKAAVTNTTDAPFLGGTVNVFVGADFLGKSWIGLVPQSAKFDLFMGVDEGVRVKREELKDKRGRSGIFNKRKVQTYAYKITVENYKDKPQSVTVYDHIPVSANEDIKVALTETSLRPARVDDATGKLTWELTVKPRETREISYEVTVDWPQDKQVSGL